MKLSKVTQAAALLGGSLGVLILILVGISQLNLIAFLRGEVPWQVVVIGSDALPFLSLLLLICLIAIWAAFYWQKASPIWLATTWIGTAAILAYALYQARFSIGPLLIPSAALLFLAGALALVEAIRRA